MKKIFFCGFLLLCFNYLAQNKTIDSLLFNFINKDLIKSSHIGIQLNDISDKKKILAYNDQKLFIPASIQKLFTTAAALSILPFDFQFETHVLYSGELNAESNYLEGDIFIVGSGDPSLESKYFKQKSFIKDLSDSLRTKGIKGVEGELKLITNQLKTYDVNSNWLWGDIGNYYGAGVSGFTFRDNTVDVFFNSSNTIGEPTTISRTNPPLDQFIIENKVISGKTTKDLAYGFGGPNNKNRCIKGEIPRNKKDFKVKISMHDPKKFLSYEVRNMIDFHDKKMPKSISLDTLLVYESPLLKQLIDNINHKSNNNYSEHILMKSMSVLDSSIGFDNAALAMHNFWIKTLNTTEKFMMVDGCGLSRKNAISPSLMNDLLEYMFAHNDQNIKNDFMNSLPIAGKTGTLKYLGDATILQNNFFGKSGSMDGIRCYAGYFRKDNKYYSFSIMLNQLTCSSIQSFKLIEQFMVEVYDQL